MKTEFKVFNTTYGIDSVESRIKEYQKEHNAEIKRIIAVAKGGSNYAIH